MYQYKKLTKAQYDEAVKTPVTARITPSVRGCQTAGGSAYFCDYVQRIILNDPTFGADEDTRASNFNRGGYKIYTTLDLDLQQAARGHDRRATCRRRTPRPTSAAPLVGVQPGTGRVLYMAQNKNYSQDPDVLNTGANYTSVNYNTDQDYGGSTGFQVGSTYKVFTLAEWLKQGHSLNETVNAERPHLRPVDVQEQLRRRRWRHRTGRTNDSAGEGGIRERAERDRRSRSTRPSSRWPTSSTSARSANDAEAFGVHRADGEPLDTNPRACSARTTIAPLTMATAFAGIANNGMVCTPIAIDKIVDGERQGGRRRRPRSARRPSTRRSPHTMAYALKGSIQRRNRRRHEPRPASTCSARPEPPTTTSSSGSSPRPRRSPARTGSATSTATSRCATSTRRTARTPALGPNRGDAHDDDALRSPSTAATPSRRPTDKLLRGRPGRDPGPDRQVARRGEVDPRPGSDSTTPTAVRRTRVAAGRHRRRHRPGAGTSVEQGHRRHGLHQQRLPRRRCPTSSARSSPTRRPR